jgi:hypothetical protein
MGVFSGSRVVAPQRAVLLAPAMPRRAAVQVMAAEQNKKRTDSAVKRAELAEDRRSKNKSRKSAIATYMKKVRWPIHDALNAGRLSEPWQYIGKSYFVAAAACCNVQA